MPNNGTSKWTDERTETLKKLWAEGLSCSHIAGAIGGLTRNAIIGKVHRLGLAGRFTRRQERLAKPQTPRVKTGNFTAKRVRAIGAARAEPIVELEAETPTNAKLFEELEAHHCRWPCSGQGLGTLFCGGDVLEDFSYCPRHCRIAYRPPERRSRAEIEIEQRKMARVREAKAAA